MPLASYYNMYKNNINIKQNKCKDYIGKISKLKNCGINIELWREG